VNHVCVLQEKSWEEAGAVNFDSVLMESTMVEAVIESLDPEGRGVARGGGKPVLVDGALVGEVVEYSVVRELPDHVLAQLERIITPSAQRVQPPCHYFGKCGGCSMQHLDPVVQVAAKQRMLEEVLARACGLAPEIIYPAIHGASWSYRQRARFSVRLVPDKGGVRVGFHQRRSSYITDMRSCEVLPPHVSALLADLRELIEESSVADRVPQVELACDGSVTALVFRNLVPLLREDETRLVAFADEKGVQVWLQPEGPDSAYLFHPIDAAALAYTLPEFDVTVHFRPTDFTQVNVATNRVLIRRALQLLDPRAGERVADLFCGLGNFSLPIARSGALVIGVEGSESLVLRAAENARRNGLDGRCEFYAANLFESTEDSLAAFGPFDKWLIDPPREGATAVIKAIDRLQAPRRIVYVSCNPVTLARDAAVLIHQKGYVLKGVGVVNMFPQTTHVESIALFERVT